MASSELKAQLQANVELQVMILDLKNLVGRVLTSATWVEMHHASKLDGQNLGGE